LSRSLASLFFDRSLGRRESLEALVRDRLSALDRAAVGAGGKTGLGTLDGLELFPEVIRQTFVQLVLIEVGRQVCRIKLVRRLAGVLVPEFRERPLDPLALSGQQFASALRIHHAAMLLPENRAASRAAPIKMRAPERSRIPPGGCRGQGKFETWDLSRLNKGAITPLGSWETELNGMFTSGAVDSKAPVTVNCSSHWFDAKDGVAAVGWYEPGGPVP
jgi:hypothetical protein